MNISLPLPLRRWVQDQVRTRGFGTASEFVRDMIRRERERTLKAAIDDKLESALRTPVSPMTEDDWDDIVRGSRKTPSRRKMP